MTAPRAGVPTTLLLPARRRFAGQPVSPGIARRLGRADRADGEPGETAQLRRHFDLLPRGWPIAALTRALDADDAPLHTWVRADPAHVRPDMTGARVMAIGALGLSAAESAALSGALRTTFGDAGMPLSAPHPERWYLALSIDARAPAFALPEDGLGADLLAHLPDGADGRRWRALLNEAQVILHNHPVNAARAAAGRPTANSLWFWGAGRFPDRVATPFAAVASDAADLRALATAAGAPNGAEGPALVDLRAQRDWAQVEAAIAARLEATRDGALDLDFADGSRWSLAARQRFRIWRRPQTTLA